MTIFGFRINERDTEENLELHGFKTIRYNKYIIALGYYRRISAALYEFPGASRCCDAPADLVFVSAEKFEEEGDALRAMFALIDTME